MIIKVRPDKNKVNSLRKMAEVTLERLNKTDKEKYPSYRNRISYEGFIIHRNYISLNKEMIYEIIKILFDRLS